MKKGIFSSWFRELATIIFTQTIQAFLLAIVMSIIISALGSQTGSTNQDGSTAAAGLLAIIALSQFGKIELLIKNIFGVTSGVADVSMQGGKGTLTAGKMLAFRGLKRLSDNGAKISQGIKSFKTGAEIKNLKGQMDEAEAAKKLASKNLEALNGNLDGKDKYKENLGEDEKLNVASGDISAAIGRLETAIRAQTTAQERNRQEDKVGDLKEKIDKLNEKRSEERKTGVSGVVESVTGAYGAAAGLAVGLADGNNIAETTLAGAGIGDTVGSSFVNSAYSGAKAIKSGSKMVSNARNRNKMIESKIKDAHDSSEEVIKQINAEIKKAEEANDKKMIESLNQSKEGIANNYKDYINTLQKHGSPSKGISATRGATKKALKKNKSLESLNYDVGKDI